MSADTKSFINAENENENETETETETNHFLSLVFTLLTIQKVCSFNVISFSGSQSYHIKRHFWCTIKKYFVVAFSSILLLNNTFTSMPIYCNLQ
jgi:hypothetical protein